MVIFCLTFYWVIFSHFRKCRHNVYSSDFKGHYKTFSFFKLLLVYLGHFGVLLPVALPSLVFIISLNHLIIFSTLQVSYAIFLKKIFEYGRSQRACIWRNRSLICFFLFHHCASWNDTQDSPNFIWGSAKSAPSFEG